MLVSSDIDNDKKIIFFRLTIKKRDFSPKNQKLYGDIAGLFLV